MATSGTSPLMVGVSGLRGIVGASLSAEVVARYAGAWAGMVGEGKGRPVMVVGRDGRKGGEEIERIAVEALVCAGCDVVRLGVAMTPTVGIAVRERGAGGGVVGGVVGGLVVTASHNPGEWNGLKPITAQGSAPMPGVAKELVARFERGEVARASGGTGRIEEDRGATEFHVRRVIAEIGRVMGVDAIRAKRLRVVVDSVNASGSRGAQMALEALGCQVTQLHGDGTGVFPHTPEPVEENLRELCGAVKRAGADIGFAQDPDADRLAIVDGSGVYIGEEYTLALGVMGLLEGGERGQWAMGNGVGPVVAANLSTSRMIDDVAKRVGGARVVRTPVGEANVVEGMRRAGAAIGGEGNGGVIWPVVGEIRDSLVGMALVLALMARRGESLAKIVEGMPRYAIVKRKMAFEPGMDARIVGRLRTMFAGATIDEQDGIRLDFNAPSGGGGAWLHARKSNTEPIFRLIAEAPTTAEANAILDRAQGAV